MPTPVALETIGNSGPLLKNTGTDIEVRNSLDNAYANLGVLAPTAAQHATTKSYVDATAGNLASRQIIRFALSLISANSITALPAGSIIHAVSLNITGVYDGGTTIAIGFAGTPAALMGTGDNNPQAIGLYRIDLDYIWILANVILATITGVPVGGSAWVIVEYSQTPNA